ncbi:prolipoprotein diacylglyceryl transferase [Paenibacillus antri]|uniref:Phosphatidylglycerol--prolipoprotein diacylglyceryl transferase n=1 Tax=Paenibacillus antri TaxID=2582848 RepID=A0A5R9G0Z3_9BACL|nr:prolipoprotein diacylglyceryl transferase [Paenibacillus antri]TLS49992.1 prolipoprotein diacylglyceryl transferase [Paenibacillus antri]
MRVTLFEIGSFSVASYGFVIALAVLLSIGVAHFLTRGTVYQAHIMNSFFYVFVAAIVGARFWHVFFFQWGYYSKNLTEIFAIWNGGISIMGAIIGGAGGMALYTWRKKLDFWEFADHLAPAVVLGQAIGRIACFLNGDAYGSPTGSQFGVVYPEGTMAFERYGAQPLWPAEIWEGQWDLIIFALLIVLRNIKFPVGVHFMIYSIMYAVGRFVLEYLRGDSPRYTFDWTAGQWTSAVMIGISVILVGCFYLRDRSKSVASSAGTNKVV